MNLPKKYLLNRKIHKASICKKKFQNYLKKKKKKKQQQKQMSNIFTTLVFRICPPLF